MIGVTVYLLLICIELLFLISISIYFSSLIYSSIKGAPYVPTKRKVIDEILYTAGLKKGKRFLELGCGDGRVVRQAVTTYHVDGVGIDINPVVLILAKIKSKIHNVHDIEWRTENVCDTNISDFDFVYVFLMPEMLARLAPKFIKNGKKGAVIISHGFKIEGLESYLFKTLKRSPFPTYYYRLKG